VRIARRWLDDLVAHAREEAPNECCGYMKLVDGGVEEVFRADSRRRSPYSYELDFDALVAANDLDDAGFGVAIYHSHPRSAPEPSQTDINLAQYPSWLQLIVSLAGDEAQVRAWRIADGHVDEEELVVEG
jgi:[CysO sulfur-carrier protein]-S-L-cysteine hydrolase